MSDILATASTPSTSIVIPVPGREAYAASARDDLRARAIDAVRRADTESAGAREAASWSDRRQQPPRETWTSVVHAEPRGAIPFLVQQLAQADAPEQETDSEAVPSARIAARQAYLTARDSTVEFLSPTPYLDIRV